MALKLTPEVERERVASIEDFERTCAFTGHNALIAKMKADGRSFAGDVAMAVIAAERATHAANAATHSPAAHAAAARTDRFPDLEAVERSALGTWASDPAIRSEFAGNKDSYVAFRKAEAKGLVRPTNRNRP